MNIDMMNCVARDEAQKLHSLCVNGGQAMNMNRTFDDRENATLLTLAVLLGAQVDLNVRGLDGKTALEIAAEQGHGDVCDALVKQMPRTIELGKSISTACASRDISLLRRLLTGVAVDNASVVCALSVAYRAHRRSPDRRRAMRIVMEDSRFADDVALSDVVLRSPTTLRMLIADGRRIDINRAFDVREGSGDAVKMTALMMAAKWGADESVRVLLAHRCINAGLSINGGPTAETYANDGGNSAAATIIALAAKESEATALLTAQLDAARRRVAQLEADAAQPQYVCVACTIEEARMVCQPCMHLCLCVGCAPRVTRESDNHTVLHGVTVADRHGRRLCPMCRVATSDIATIFTP